ncbi:hypothetical protein ACH5RR_006635 [Cinchona calisaya]|uniref:Protein arginine methyltransferase NDUFAF7 n=1 Tax=Cinchona calisaya TaxID=153742 RepID=A0ABD3API2_9GENT
MIDIDKNSLFCFVLSPRHTRATLYLTKCCNWTETEDIAKLSYIEICPKAMDLTQTIAKRIENVTAHDSITQSQLLKALAVNFQVEALLENYTDEQAHSLGTGYWHLVSEGEVPFSMGPGEQTPVGMAYAGLGVLNAKVPRTPIILRRQQARTSSEALSHRVIEILSEPWPGPWHTKYNSDRYTMLQVRCNYICYPATTVVPGYNVTFAGIYTYFR